ncbi:hypothetical protein Hanom_Chr05g00458961 [Helianthus anomalus]
MICQSDVLFQQRDDARRRLTFTCIQKCIATLRQLAHGILSDAMDEYLEIFEKFACDSLHFFVEGSYPFAHEDIYVNQHCLISNAYTRFTVKSMVSPEWSVASTYACWMGYVSYGNLRHEFVEHLLARRPDDLVLD